MQLIFVRHAQSENNVIGDNVGTREEFERRRSYDAELSPLGVSQTIELGQGVHRAMLKQLSPKMRELSKTQRMKKRVCLAISPMKRTLLTAKPVLAALESLATEEEIDLASVQVVPHIFENGGCYNEKNGVFTGHPGMSKSEIRSIVPRAEVPDALEKGWWKSSTRETEEELEIRVTKTTEWIKATACIGLYDVLFVVSHQDFSCRCIRSLMRAEGITWLYNASFTSFTLYPIPGSNSNGDLHGDSTLVQTHNCKIIVDWINSVDHLSLENIS